jgi:hypothetical protein
MSQEESPLGTDWGERVFDQVQFLSSHGPRDHREFLLVTRVINCLIFECFSWLSAFHSPERNLQEYEKQTGIVLAIHSFVE